MTPKSRKQFEKAQRRLSWKQALTYFSQTVFFGGALGLIAIGIFRFLLIDMSSEHDTILNIYFIMLGVVIALSQMQFSWVSRNFRFINYHWGKALLSLFLSSVAFSTDEIALMQYFSCLYFFIVGSCFTALAIADRASDRA